MTSDEPDTDDRPAQPSADEEPQYDKFVGDDDEARAILEIGRKVLSRQRAKSTDRPPTSPSVLWAGLGRLRGGRRGMHSYLTKGEGTCRPGQRADLTGCTPAQPDAQRDVRSARPESRLSPPTAAASATHTAPEAAGLRRPRVPPRTAADRVKDRRPAVPATPAQVQQLVTLVAAADAAAPAHERGYLRLADLRLRAFDTLGWNWQQFDAALYGARRAGALRLRVNDGTGGAPSATDRNAGFEDEDGALYDRVSPGV